MTAELFDNLKNVAAKYGWYVEIQMLPSGKGTVSIGGKDLFSFDDLESLVVQLQKETV